MTGNINKSVSLSLKGHKFPVFLRVKASVASVEGEKKAKQLVPQKTCPYKGSPIDTKLFVEYQGQKIYVCCEPCLKVVEKNPIEAVERLRDLYGEKIR
jgi:YHS domain-containing protein